MKAVVVVAFLLVALRVTMSRGPGSAFAYVYLPALLLLGAVSGLDIPGIPDLNPPTGAVFGILFGSLLGRRGPKFHIAATDYVVALLLLAYIVSAVTTENYYTGVSIFGTMALNLVAPYFIVRLWLEQRSSQRQALFALVSAALIIAPFALIEMRLWPFYYGGLLEAVGIRDYEAGPALGRFSLFRAHASFYHPIDLGVSSVLIFAGILILAVRSGVGVRNTWVRLGLASAVVGLVAALSFTAFLGAATALGLYLTLSAVPYTRRFLGPAVMALIAAGIAYAGYLASEPLLLDREPGDYSSLQSSYYIRRLIIKEAWSYAISAGPLGWGRLVKVADLKSLDNAYLLIAISRGWVALGLWLALPLVLAQLASRALRRARSLRMVQPILFGFSATIGAMIAMFTVWFGFTYSSLFMIIVALTVNATRATTPGLKRAQASSPAPLRLPPRPLSPV